MCGGVVQLEMSARWKKGGRHGVDLLCKVNNDKTNKTKTNKLKIKIKTKYKLN